MDAHRSCVTARRRKRGPATREQPGQTMSSHNSGLTDSHTETSNLAEVRCSQDISLRLVFIITTDSGCWINFSLLLSILPCTALPIRPCFSAIVQADQATRLKTSQVSTRSCQACSLLAIAPNQHRMMLQNDAHPQECFERPETARTLTRQWKYCDYYCKPSVYE